MSIVTKNYYNILIDRDARVKFREVVEFSQTMGVIHSLNSQKQYFKVTHTIDIGLNNEDSNEIWILGHECGDN